MKYKIIVGIIIVVAVVVAIYYVKQSKQKSDGPVKPVVTQNTNSESESTDKYFESKYIKEADSNAPYVVNVAYPAFPEDAKASEIIADYIAGLVSQFKSQVGSIQPDKDEFKSSLDIAFTVPTYTPDLLAVVFDYNYYSSGAAHPNRNSVTFTYNRKTSTQVHLEDLFTPGSSYMEKLSALAQSKLLQAMKGDESDPEWVKAGTEPNKENFQNFIPTTQGLRIIFDPYQVAPYAFGSYDIIIPLSDLQDIVPQNGILQALKK